MIELKLEMEQNPSDDSMSHSTVDNAGLISPVHTFQQVFSLTIFDHKQSSKKLM
jgi:hypothetical protein